MVSKVHWLTGIQNRCIRPGTIDAWSMVDVEMSSSAGGPLNVSQWECGSNPLYIRAWKWDCPEKSLRTKKKSRFFRMDLSSMVIRTWLEDQIELCLFSFSWCLVPSLEPLKAIVSTDGSLALFISLALTWNGARIKKNRGQSAIFIKKKSDEINVCCSSTIKKISLLL